MFILLQIMFDVLTNFIKETVMNMLPCLSSHMCHIPLYFWVFSGPGPFLYGLVLPPGFHILLSCQGQQNIGQGHHTTHQSHGEGHLATITVTMAMQHTMLLPHVNAFLKSVFKSVTQ